LAPPRDKETDRTPVIELTGVWFSYNGRPVLRDVNITVHQGDFMAVIGPNGGGKTTLVKLILGLLPPHQGEVKVFGVPPEQAVLRMGYVPQDSGFNPGIPVSVEQVVMMGRMRGGRGFRVSTSTDRSETQTALERVRMWEYRGRGMAELSGGQRQRVYMARALVSHPDLLLLDEPTAGVDTEGRAEFYELLRELNQSVTIVLVSHDLMVVSSHVKSVACVNQELHFHDRPEITKDMLQKAYHCPVELIAHGLPHRVLDTHSDG
jgi:zinc transport system ATP-binding protein